jgi:hypothetical protein
MGLARRRSRRRCAGRATKLESAEIVPLVGGRCLARRARGPLDRSLRRLLGGRSAAGRWIGRAGRFRRDLDHGLNDRRRRYRYETGLVERLGTELVAKLGSSVAAVFVPRRRPARVGSAFGRAVQGSELPRPPEAAPGAAGRGQTPRAPQRMTPAGRSAVRLRESAWPPLEPLACVRTGFPGLGRDRSSGVLVLSSPIRPADHCPFHGVGRCAAVGRRPRRDLRVVLVRHPRPLLTIGRGRPSPHFLGCADAENG